MKVDIGVPSREDLLKSYEILQHASPQKPTLKELALFSNWSRFDPRLGEICAQYFSDHWEKINPMRLRREAKKTAWPACIGVLLQFSEKILRTDSKRRLRCSLFSHWMSLVTFNLKRGAGDLYFFGLRKIGGEAMALDAELPSAEYEKWGFLARENLCSKKGKVSFSKIKRMQTLKVLSQSKGFLTSQDYWLAIEKSVSLRQAERDMHDCGYLSSVGHTKGKRWVRN